MKRLCAGLLLVVLLGLCACGQAGAEGTSAVVTTAVIATLPVEYPYVPAKPMEIKTSKNDPYSYVIKAYRRFELERFWNHCHSEGATEQLVQGFTVLKSKDEWSDCFQGACGIVSGESGYKKSQFQYALHDIDSDGVDELLLGVQGAYGFTLFDIYSIRNGVAVQQLQKSGSNNAHMSVLQNGTVKISGGRDKDFYDDFYRFENGQLRYGIGLQEHLIVIPTDDGSDAVGLETEYARSDARDALEYKKISEKEYERLRRQYDDREAELAWAPLWCYKQDLAGAKR